MGALDQLGPVRAGDLFDEPADEHAPTATADRVDVVDLEGHVGVVGSAELGPGVRAHDNGVLVLRVVHREDQRIVLGVHAKPLDLLRGQEFKALVVGLGLQDRTVGFRHEYLHLVS
jgi:hypothetical protein